MTASGWHRKARTPAELERRKQYASREHRELRQSIQVRIDRGEAVSCWRCHRPIHTGQRWHLGHDDHDRTRYRGAECPSCNLKAAARKGGRMVHARRKALPTVRRRRLL